MLARYDFSKQIFLRAEIEDLEDGGVDVDAYALALAYIFNPDSTIAYHIAAVLEHEDEEYATIKGHSLGKGLELGFHADLNQQFTLHGELAFVTEHGDGIAEAGIALLYTFSEPFGLNVEFGFDEDSNSSIEIGLRYTFR